LTGIVADWVAPPQKDLSDEEFNRKHEERQAEQRLQAAMEVEEWRRWRETLLRDPNAAFEPESKPRTIYNLYHWLEKQAHDSDHRNVWDEGALRDAFGDTVAGLAREAFKEQWRTVEPTPWSMISSEQRNSTPYAWIFGLC